VQLIAEFVCKFECEYAPEHARVCVCDRTANRNYYCLAPPPPPRA
jgi:hypothetical protein